MLWKVEENQNNIINIYIVNGLTSKWNLYVLWKSSASYKGQNMTYLSTIIFIIAVALVLFDNFIWCSIVWI